jgi:DNA polymerase-4
VIQARPKLYVEYHHRIREAIETCIPIEAVMSIDEVACKLDKVQVQPHVARKLALSIKTAIREKAGVALLCSIGIAPNKLLAKLACDMQKPDGLTLLRPEDLPAAILHLKPQEISGIGKNMLKRLNQTGIFDMSQLWTADAQVLKRVWNGVNGLRFHALLHGADLPSPATVARSMSHQHVLAPEERTIEKATPVVRRLLMRVAQRLRTDEFCCRRLSLDIKWAQGLGHYAEERRFQETQDTQFLLSSLMNLWGAVPNLKPLRIGVVLSDLVPSNAHQTSLFDKPESIKLTSAIDKLNSRFGRGTISYGSSADPMTSKIAFRRVPTLDEF